MAAAVAPLARKRPEAIAAAQKRLKGDFVQAVLASGCPIRRLLKGFNGADAPDSQIGRKAVAKALHAYRAVDTPYGSVIDYMQIADNHGGTVKVEYINPFALIYLCSMESDYFGNFFASFLVNKGRIALYCDEVSPSDGLKFEQNRAYNSVFFTFLDLPAWFRSRSLGWLPLAHIPVELIKSKTTTWPKVFRGCFNVFWGNEDGGCNLELVGVRIRLAGQWHHTYQVIKASYACMCADMKALASTCSVKLNGTKSCCKCKNIIGHCAPFEDREYVVHVTTPNVHKFDRHTKESFRGMCDHLTEIYNGGNRAVLKEHEQTYGLNYEEGALLFDPKFGPMMNMPDSYYPDTMHNVLASGGFGHYEVNEYIRRIVRCGVSLEQLDEWKLLIIMPMEGHTKLCKRWFKDRTIDKDDAAVRSYAGELITVISFLCTFGEEFLLQDGKLIEETECLQLLRRIVDLTLSLNPDNADLLDATTVEHHKKFIKLYPGACKIKPHMQLHVAEQVKLHKAIITCFGPERRHQFTKQIASHCFSKTGHTLHSYELHHILSLVKEPTMFEPTFLVGKTTSVALQLHGLIPGMQEMAEVSRRLQTDRGVFSKGDLLAWSFTDRMQVGKALLFFSLRDNQGRKHYYGYVSMLAHLEGPRWTLRGQSETIVAASELLSTCPWMKEGDSVRPIFPSVVRS
jgi:hypothetical protein